MGENVFVAVLFLETKPCTPHGPKVSAILVVSVEFMLFELKTGAVLLCGWFVSTTYLCPEEEDAVTSVVGLACSGSPKTKGRVLPVRVLEGNGFDDDDDDNDAVVDVPSKGVLKLKPKTFRCWSMEKGLVVIRFARVFVFVERCGGVEHDPNMAGLGP